MTESSRDISQRPIPILAEDTHPYTMVLRCAGRTRPKVSHSASPKKSGQCSLREAAMARAEPIRSQKIPEPMKTVTMFRDARSTPWRSTRS